MHQNDYCINCSNFLDHNDKFCSACGQKAVIHKLTIGHIFHEVFHAITHTDKSIFSLIGNLARRPGKVAADYAAGKRKKYFNPFTFFVLCIGFFVLSNNIFKAYGQVQEPDPTIIASLPTEEAKKNYITLIQRLGNTSKFLQKNTNIIAMVAIPFFSLLTFSMLRRKKWNYAEHLVANILFISFANLIFTLIALPLMGMTVGTTLYFIILFSALFIQIIYIAAAHYQFQGAVRKRYYLRTFATWFLAILLWNIVIMTATMLYIFRSDFFNALSRMWK